MAILVTQVTPLVKFVLYTDQAGMWRVQAVTQEGTAFTNRLGLLEAPTRVRRLLVEIPMTGPPARQAKRTAQARVRTSYIGSWRR